MVMVNNEHWYERATPESCSLDVSALSGCHQQVERK
jgi:hypothetical protein